MNNETTEKIKAALDRLRGESLKAFEANVRRTYSSEDHGHYVPDNMVRKAVGLADASVRKLVADAISDVLEIMLTPDAFALLQDATLDHLEKLEEVVEQGHGMPLTSVTLKFAADRFDIVRSGLIHTLDSHRPSVATPKHAGGRPPKYEWERALAHIAALANLPDGLPTGPKAQADITRLMNDWFVLKQGTHPDDTDKRAKLVVEEIQALKGKKN
jgi:hypothetical protein